LTTIKSREYIYASKQLKEDQEMKAEILDKIATLLTVAFGLVAALAWNGAIMAIFLAIFGTAENITAMLVYAVVVTIIAVLVTIWLARVAKRAKGES